MGLLQQVPPNSSGRGQLRARSGEGDLSLDSRRPNVGRGQHGLCERVIELLEGAAAITASMVRCTRGLQHAESTSIVRPPQPQSCIRKEAMDETGARLGLSKLSTKNGVTVARKGHCLSLELSGALQIAHIEWPSCNPRGQCFGLGAHLDLLQTANIEWLQNGIRSGHWLSPELTWSSPLANIAWI